MIGKRISHYKILEELGSGGMGVVYKAEDTKLKRTVALKFVVPRMLRKDEDKKRFLREAQTAASLNHPHICTIYQIEEVGEHTFIAMEYVEGHSLKEIVGKSPLEPEKVLYYAIQIAEGLEEAHEKKIVHRDVKSANIMVTPKAQTKIMDFGLAKIVSESQLAETATIMGTVAYMSPEQACGDPPDHRSDIWSLGIVMYEMLTGHVPFHEEHEQLVLHSILNKYHEPVSSWRSDIPYELERIVDKCLEKSPSERYQNAGELLSDLRQLKQETESGIMPRTKPVWHKRRVKKLKKFLAPGILIIMAAVLVGGYFLFDWFQPASPWVTSIAVLPMKNLSLYEENEALCLSMSKDIIRKIGLYSDEVRVIPHDLTLALSRQGKTSINIGRDLDVEFILDSTLQSDGDIFKIDADLISVKENRLRDSFPYETSKQADIGILDIQDKISKTIVEKLGFHLKESGLIEAKKGEPKNEEAYKWYAQGLNLIDNRDLYTKQDEWFHEAIGMLTRALELEPDYALAYWGMGAAYEAYYVAKGDKNDRDLAIENWEEAHKLNPGLAEANLGLGWAYFYKEDLEKASKSFKQALDIDPDSPLINSDVGVFLVSVGLYQQSHKYYDIAIQREPFYLRAYELSSPSYWYIGEYEKGYEMIKRALELDSNNARFFLEMAKHLIMLKRFDEAEKAIQEFETRLPASQEGDLFRALILALKHKRSEALELIRGTEKPYIYPVTCVYALLGMKDEALEYIRLGIKLGFEKNQHYLYSYMMMKENPCFDSLRDDPRFKEILDEQRKVYYSRTNQTRDIL
jgi:serine/threonine protein kinase/Tfp pilus assembly protein PilF